MYDRVLGSSLALLVRSHGLEYAGANLSFFMLDPMT